MAALKFDQDALTLGDFEEFEKVTGRSLMKAMEGQVVRDENGKAVADPNDPKGGPLRETQLNATDLTGLIYVMLRKENPELTLEEVRNMKMSEIEWEEPTENPTEGAKDGESEPEKSA